MTEQLARFKRETRHLDNEACLNCSTAYTGKFCPECGQESYTGAPTAWAFIYEFLTKNVLEGGKLPLTLWYLLRYPGLLTVDFLEGRRARFVRPVRLFLGLSALYFFFLIVLGEKKPEKKLQPARQSSEQSANSAAVPKVAAKGVAKSKQNHPSLASDAVAWVSKHLPEGAAKRRGQQFLALPVAEQERQLSQGEFSAQQKAVFFLLPLNALFFMLLFRGRGITYGTHLLFLFHFQSFCYLFYLIVLVLPLPVMLEDLSRFVYAIYLYYSLRRVYRCGMVRAFLYAGLIRLAELIITNMVMPMLALFGVFGLG